MTASEATIAKLIELLTVDKKYLPGDKLPNEVILAKELGVSRNTLRTAIQYLAGQGVFSVHVGRGTFVTEMPPVKEDFGFGKLYHIQLKLADLYELRLMLEPQMAYYAALRASDEELNQILECGERIFQAAQEQEEDPEGNQQFHNAIARAVHNEFGYQIMEILNRALVTAFRESHYVQSLSVKDLFDHRMIMSYLQMRNAEGAKLSMDLHIRSAAIAYGIFPKNYDKTEA